MEESLAGMMGLGLDGWDKLIKTWVPLYPDLQSVRHDS